MCYYRDECNVTAGRNYGLSQCAVAFAPTKSKTCSAEGPCPSPQHPLFSPPIIVTITITVTITVAITITIAVFAMPVMGFSDVMGEKSQTLIVSVEAAPVVVLDEIG